MDLSFFRHGRPLEEWLPELVSEDRGQRLAASEALGGMWTGLPRYSTPWDQIDLTKEMPDTGAQMDRFSQAVRDAVERPEFPKASFVRRLMLYLLVRQRDWLEAAKQLSFRDEKLGALETRLIEQMLKSEDAAERERAAKRFGRLFCAALARDEQLIKRSEGSEAPGLLASVVFDALDTALLEAEDLLHEMVANRHLRHQAIRALERLGPAAAPFVPDLLEQLELGHRFEGPRVLGTVAGSEPAVAEELVAHLRSGSPESRLAVAASLEAAGPSIGEPLTSQAITWLRDLVRTDTRHAKALASLGRHREDVLEELLALAAPRPPRIQTTPYGSFDEAMYDRGVALDGLRYFTSFPERVLPVLVDAIETFEEYDPDLTYQGEHERVLASLRAFGTSAALLAVPVLAHHVRQSGGEEDWDVVRFLGEMGPAAEVALPALRELESYLRHLDPDEEGLTEPPDERDHPAAWAIWRICGGSTL